MIFRLWIPQNCTKLLLVNVSALQNAEFSSKTTTTFYYHSLWDLQGIRFCQVWLNMNIAWLNSERRLIMFSIGLLYTIWYISCLENSVWVDYDTETKTKPEWTTGIIINVPQISNKESLNDFKLLRNLSIPSMISCVIYLCSRIWVRLHEWANEFKSRKRISWHFYQSCL